MDIEALVTKYERLIPAGAYTLAEGIRAALTELSAAHAIELRAYEATVQNMAERIRQLEAERVPEGWTLVPVEPTDAMLDEIRWTEDISYRAMLARYRAMLAAAPAMEGE